MPPVSIPLFDDASFSETVALDGNNYGLTFTWNGRGQFWSMDIADGNGNVLKTGLRLNVAYPVKLQFNTPGLPSGDFLLIDANNATWMQEAGRNDFVSGRKLELCYINKRGITGAQQPGLSPAQAVEIVATHFQIIEDTGKLVVQYSETGTDPWQTIMTLAG